MHPRQVFSITPAKPGRFSSPGPGGSEINTKADFFKHYDFVINDRVRTAIEELGPADLFKNDQGLMVGDGELWFAAVGYPNSRYAILTINNDGPPGSAALTEEGGSSAGDSPAGTSAPAAPTAGAASATPSSAPSGGTQELNTDAPKEPTAAPELNAKDRRRAKMKKFVEDLDKKNKNK